MKIHAVVHIDHTTLLYHSCKVLVTSHNLFSIEFGESLDGFIHPWFISLWDLRCLTRKRVLCHIPSRFVDGEKTAYLIVWLFVCFYFATFWMNVECVCEQIQISGRKSDQLLPKWDSPSQWTHRVWKFSIMEPRCFFSVSSGSTEHI